MIEKESYYVCDLLKIYKSGKNQAVKRTAVNLFCNPSNERICKFRPTASAREASR